MCWIYYRSSEADEFRKLWTKCNKNIKLCAFKMHLCAVRLSIAGGMGQSNYNLRTCSLAFSCCMQFFGLFHRCVISSRFLCMPHVRWTEQTGFFSGSGTQQGNALTSSLQKFPGKLKPKLIPYYPITSMKLNVDDSIKDNFLSAF